MPAKKKPYDGPVLTAEWPLPAAATLGSSVRAKGILLEVRAKLPSAAKKSIDVRGNVLVLTVPENEPQQFKATSAIVTRTLDGIENLQVIPREIEDILTIKTSERHRWLKDGRLKSAGTRTVKLRGRARKITFHVFDPRFVETVLNDDLVTTWREDDIETKAENRRRASEMRALTRRPKASSAKPTPADSSEDAAAGELRGLAEFLREGFLR